MILSPSEKSDINRPRSKSVYLEVCEIAIVNTLTGLQENFLRLVRNNAEITSSGNVYTPVNFKYQFPNNSNQDKSVVNISFPIINTNLLNNLRGLNEGSISVRRLKFRLGVVHTANINKIIYGKFTLFAKSPTFNRTTITFPLAVDSLEDIIFPFYRYSRGDYPGLY